jgi:tetratricopeptide (TPR) repeat protein
MVQQKDLAGEAASLGELGSLYGDAGRPEDAVRCHQQSVDIQVKLGNRHGEGLGLNNLALTLVKLRRYDDARRELRRAVECLSPYGHAGQLWKTWHLMHALERTAGNPEAAARARELSVESYLDYRRAGGQSGLFGAELCELAARSIPQGDTRELEKLLDELSSEGTPATGKVLRSKLQAILGGARDAALADDPELYYQDAAELRLLLERLGPK